MIAIACPGQGSQKVGFLSSWLEIESFKLDMEMLSDSIGLDLIKHGTVSDEETIRQTEIAQPLILAASIATANLLDLNKVNVVAGHSVGEVAAGYVAGVLDKVSAMKLVDVRGKAMMKAAQQSSDTAMAAVLGGVEEEVLEKINQLELTPANYNGAGQIVAAGLKTGIEALASNPPTGAKVIPLAVAGAFHTKYMDSAVQTLNVFVSELTLQNPKKVLLSNQLGQEIQSGTQYIERLVGQVANPVRWDLCMKTMTELGVTAMVELAPGGTLVGLAKRGMPGINTVALKTPDDLSKAQELIAGDN